MSNVIIQINGNKVFFNDDVFIPVETTNLPVHDIDFGKIKKVYWLVDQLSYNKDSGSLQVKVIDYFLRDYEDFSGQHPKTTIKHLHFVNLPSSEELKLGLSYYQKQMTLLDRAMETGYEEVFTGSAHPEGKLRKNPLFRSYPENEKMELDFDIWFKDASFKLGYVVFDKNIPELKQLVRFKIENDFLLPEFGLIKSYFMKALGTRKFDVKATVFVENRKVSGTKAASLTVRKINEELIDSIKNIRTLDLLHPPVKSNVDKRLFTSEDIFENFDDDLQGNVFDQSEEDILKYILEKAQVRNRKQLEYLSGIKQAPQAKLRFTLHPFFGFLFTVEGEKMMHFIWELLNSHATYVWSLEKGDQELKMQYRRIEDAINQVRNSGRENYKSAYRSSHIDQDLVFHVIHHPEVNSPFIEGFVRWKHRLNEILV